MGIKSLNGREVQGEYEGTLPIESVEYNSNEAALLIGVSVETFARAAEEFGVDPKPQKKTNELLWTLSQVDEIAGLLNVDDFAGLCTTGALIDFPLCSQVPVVQIT